MLEKVAFIKGLLQGMKLSDNDPYKELFQQILDVLDDLAATVTDMEENLDELDAYVAEIDEDLEAVEDYLDEEDEDEDALEDDFYSIVCPTCGEEFSVDDEVAELGKINCPNCGEDLEFDLSDLEPCEGCELIDGENQE